MWSGILRETNRKEAAPPDGPGHPIRVATPELVTFTPRTGIITAMSDGLAVLVA